LQLLGLAKKLFLRQHSSLFCLTVSDEEKSFLEFASKRNSPIGSIVGVGANVIKAV